MTEPTTPEEADDVLGRMAYGEMWEQLKPKLKAAESKRRRQTQIVEFAIFVLLLSVPTIAVLLIVLLFQAIAW